MTTFWSAFIIILTVANFVGCLWLLQYYSKRRDEGTSPQTTVEHVWDGDLREYNNPLPRWWLGLFWLCALFGVMYLVIYPGLGSFQGVTGWTQQGQYDAEVEAAELRYAGIFSAFAAVPIDELAHNPDALRAGRNLYLNNCAVCHGADGRGARGFPNLTDAAWLYGGTPEAIVHTLKYGRTGIMPPLGAALGEAGVTEVVAYLRSFRGQPADDAALLEAGQQKYAMFCSACHGPTAQGNPALGAPDLTDDDWLHGSSAADMRDVINNGRVNVMPAQLGLLGEERLHTVAAYVLSLGAGLRADAGSGTGAGGDGQR